MIKVVLVVQLITACVTLATTQVQISDTGVDEANDCASLWFTPVNGSCKCTDIPGIKCSNGSLQVKVGYCMTWDGHQPVLGACPFFATNPKLSFTTEDSTSYEIPTNTTGSELNTWTCGHLNRQGLYCKKCSKRYGPAIFSDSATCADCSQYKNVWFVYFLFQIFLETILFTALALFKSSRVFGLINVLTFYWQMILYAIATNSSLYRKLLLSSNSEVLQFLLTIFGIWNLDFLRYLMPPMCIRDTTKAINTLWFDFVIALYPFLLCAVLFLCIQLHN